MVLKVDDVPRPQAELDSVDDLQGDGASGSGSDSDLLAALQAKMEKLGDTLALRGSEIDSIQVEQAQKKRPFYRQPAILVSIVAVLVSVLATGLSFWSSQDSSKSASNNQLLGQREKLTTVLQDIATWRASVTEPGFDVSGGRPALDQANFLIRSLEASAYRATAWEKVEVAMGYGLANEAPRELELAQQAEAASQTSQLLADKFVSARTVGQGFFETARPVEGRAAFRRALAYVDNSTGYHVNVKSRYKVEALGIWINEELISDGCRQARQLLDEATQIATQTTPNFVQSQLNQIQAYRSIVDASCR